MNEKLAKNHRRSGERKRAFKKPTRGEDDLFNLVVEVKGYRLEDAKQKKQAMETQWIPGINRLGTYGRWAFLELTDIYEMDSAFEVKVNSAIGKVIAGHRSDTK